MAREKIYIYGIHAVTEALKKKGTVQSVLLSSHGDFSELRSRLKRAQIEVQELNGKTMPREVGDEAVHQGVVARVYADMLVQSYRDFIETLEVTPDTALVVLDDLEDVQNIGAVVRAAAAFGAAGVVIPEHNTAPITGTVVKVSAGMIFKVPVVVSGNLQNTLKDLKERGFWVYGLAGDGETVVYDEDFSAPSVVVLGNEHEGLRKKTRECCDIMLRIPLNPQCESLNAAASMSVALSAWSQKHPRALK